VSRGLVEDSTFCIQNVVDLVLIFCAVALFSDCDMFKVAKIEWKLCYVSCLVLLSLISL